jgi:anion-transporting  ArsA/GET3 family ATPase
MKALADAHVIVCAGSGGAGKTTVSAAIALGLAATGRRVALVTIDPARRLADALGLDTLPNHPVAVDDRAFAAAGVALDGRLSAMMLDPRRTFDELIEALAPDARTRERILANRIYQGLSDAVAGSQEFTAVAKLDALARDAAYDVIVLDTPPSRNALDFLDAPDRLLAFLEGRTLQALLPPTSVAARAAGGSVAFTLGLLRRVTGAQLLAELQTFFRALGGLLDGFRAQADAVAALLAAEGTVFVVVAAPTPASVDETVFLVERLRAAGMTLAGVVVNRVHPQRPGGADAQATRARLAPLIGGALAERVAEADALVQALAAQDAAALARLRGALPGAQTTVVEDRAVDVHDAGGLLGVRDQLLEAA